MGIQELLQQMEAAWLVIHTRCSRTPDEYVEVIGRLLDIIRNGGGLS